MNEPVVTIIGNATADPELRFTPSGAAVVTFTIASTPRSFDRAANEWKDGTPLFLRCSAWREMAENIAEHVRKGRRVIASGRLVGRSWETREGEKRTSIELEVDDIGLSMRFATRQQERQHESPQSIDQDPWASAQTDEPPF